MHLSAEVSQHCLSVSVVFITCFFALNILQIIIYAARLVSIFHGRHLSCSMSSPVLYKVNKIISVVSLTYLYCDLSTVGYCRYLQSILPHFPSWAMSVSSVSYDFCVVITQLLLACFILISIKTMSQY